jgi:hypothetical protein
MTEHRIRRTGVSENMVRRVYIQIMALSAPTTLDLRRAMPNLCATSISKSVGELKDRG